MSIAENPLKLKLFVIDGEVPDFTGAACADEGLDPDIWFLDDAEISKVAKGYCGLCPYGPPTAANDYSGDDSCFEWAMKVEEQTGYFAYGIFGGRDAAYRQRLLDLKRLVNQISKESEDD